MCQFWYFLADIHLPTISIVATQDDYFVKQEEAAFFLA
jgi:hypothetical protein